MFIGVHFEAIQETLYIAIQGVYFASLSLGVVQATKGAGKLEANDKILALIVCTTHLLGDIAVFRLAWPFTELIARWYH